MGLDAVEMVMEVEDRFGIQIPHNRWSEMRTVGDMCRIVSSLLHTNGIPVCRNIPAFCALRRGFQQLGHDRSLIRPATTLTELLRGRGHITGWSRLSAGARCELPELRRPGELVAVLVAFPFIALFVTIWASFQLVRVEHFPYVIVSILLSWPAYAILAEWATRPFACCLPFGCTTVGDLVRECLSLNDFSPIDDVHHAALETYFHEVRRIVSETLNIPETEIGLQSRFIDDLRMD
jgi:acyl carrier protein